MGESSDRGEGLTFQPKFGPDGLVACVTMLEATLATGIMHYWSRSRAELWRKGDTSGQTQALVEMRVDCDQDALVAYVEVGGDGGACHTGRRSCFYRRIETSDGSPRLAFVDPTAG